ncbi:TetR family transcriptional regulator [Jiangella mangrovi]|uniref:AcrR family transcriptional regulator n=1 Tax=Jiangella mangrovi TaxID=1524084 RepID=A0A7W9GT18_9ACTN|nr:AcrR family transcriptional regulator [Jiangella mangrovi]
MNNERRTYTSALRAEQTRLTQRRILDAGHRLFVEQGYGPTTIAAVAAAAEVSAQTVYNAFGSKPALLKHVYDVVLAGDDEPIPLAQRPEVQAMYALPDPAEFLRGYAGLARTLSERLGPLMLVIAAGAGSGDPELTAHIETTDGERLIGAGMAAGRVQELGGLRPGLAAEAARDRLWTLTSIDVWRLLRLARGWSADQYEDWIGEAMCAAILARP